MINIEEFAKKIEKEFEEVDSGIIEPETNYREIEGFGSMHALILIALIDNEFDVLLKGEDLKQTETVQDLYTMILNKLEKN